MNWSSLSSEPTSIAQRVKHTGNKFCTSGGHLVLQCTATTSVPQSGLGSVLHALLLLCACLGFSVRDTTLRLCRVVTHRAQPILHVLPMSLAHIRSTVDIQLAYATATAQAVYLGPGSCKSPMHASSCISCTSLFCRKPVWAKLKNAAYEGLTGKLYTPLPATAAQACLQSRSLGVAKLRLLPKKTGQSYAKPGAITLSLYLFEACTLDSAHTFRLSTHASLCITPGAGIGNSPLTVRLTCAPSSLRL